MGSPRLTDCVVSVRTTSLSPATEPSAAARSDDVKRPEEGRPVLGAGVISAELESASCSCSCVTSERPESSSGSVGVADALACGSIVKKSAERSALSESTRTRPAHEKGASCELAIDHVSRLSSMCDVSAPLSPSRPSAASSSSSGPSDTETDWSSAPGSEMPSVRS